MSSDDILVVPGEPPRSAVILNEEPLRIQWEDTGLQEDIGGWPEGSRRVVKGTLAHRVAVDPAGVRIALESPATAIEIVLQLLKEVERPLPVQEIKQRLSDPKGSYCLPKSLVEKGLTRLPARLESQPSVEVTFAFSKTPGKGANTSKVPEYAWAKSTRCEPEGPQSAVDVPPVKRVNEPEALAVEGMAASGAPTERAPQDGEPRRTVVPEETYTERDATPGSPQPEDALAFITGAELPATLDLTRVSAAKVVDRLAGMNDRSLARLISQLKDLERFDLAVLLLAGDRNAKSVSALVRDWPTQREDDLVRGLTWLAKSGLSLSTPLGMLSHRKVQPSDALVAFAVAQLGPSAAENRPMLLRIVQAAPAPATVRALTGINVNSLLRLINREPLGSRSRLLWAAMRVDPDSVRSPATWGTATTVNDLVELSTRSPDDALLADPWVSAQIAGPILLAEVRALSTRRELARALSWPNQLLRMVPAPQLATLVRRASERDPDLRGAVEVLSGSPEIERLRARIFELEREAGDARQEAAEARAAEAHARAAEERSFRRAAAAERQQVSASQGELRQAQIDGIRALVQVLALGARLDGGILFSEGLDRLRAEARIVGVSVRGVVGTTDKYDPTEHELLGGERAEMVEIREPGYQFDGPGGPVVLRRAVVVPVATG